MLVVTLYAISKTIELCVILIKFKLLMLLYYYFEMNSLHGCTMPERVLLWNTWHLKVSHSGRNDSFGCVCFRFLAKLHVFSYDVVKKMFLIKKKKKDVILIMPKSKCIQNAFYGNFEAFLVQSYHTIGETLVPLCMSVSFINLLNYTVEPR